MESEDRGRAMKGMQHLRSIKLPIARGIALGAVAGFALSAVYGGLVLAFLIALMVIPRAGTPISDYAIQVVMASATTSLAVPCIGCLGILPGTLWGALAGLLIGGLVRVLGQWLSPVRSALLGAVAVLWPFLFPFPIGTGAEVRVYLLWQGVPSVISVVGGRWIGYWLWWSVNG